MKNGRIEIKEDILVRPHELRFRDINKQIHGISENDVIGLPEFNYIWENIYNYFDNKIILAHNANFDIDALNQTLNFYNIPLPIYKYICTQKLAQLAFSELKNYRLDDVASYLELEHHHHNSLSDSYVAANIGIKGIPLVDKKIYSYSSEELTAFVSKKNSEESKNGYLNFGEKKIDSDLLKPDLINADPANPFYNKRVVFTGDLIKYTRQEVAEKIQKLGADINTAISKKTNIVIVGEGAGPSKMKKLQDLQAEGFAIRIIYEEEFLSLLAS